MANNISTYLENAIMDWLTKNTAMPTAPANLYINPLTTMPTAQDGTGLVEASGATRQAVANTSGWNARTTSGTARQATNASQIQWTNSSGSSWTVLGIGIWDASTAGNLLGFVTLSANQTVGNGSVFTIAAGNLTLGVD
jgi:hypothetical protein